MLLQTVPPQGVLEMLAILERAGYPAFLVGGCVRDALLGRRPNDWDLCTAARPEQVQQLFDHTVPTGIRHGTVTVFYGNCRAEVTTFRQESRYSDHRRPDCVVFTDSLEADLSRRDFTMNAMAMDATGTLYDPFGGRNDLAEGRIRCVGDARQRFREDALRMFRALRFSAQLGFSPDPELMEALVELAPEARFVAPERIREELDKLLLSPRPDGLQAMIETGLLDGYVAHRSASCAGLRRLPPERMTRWAGVCLALRRSDAIPAGESFLRSLRLDRHTVNICSTAAELALSGLPDTVPGKKRLLAQYGPETVRCAFACAGRDPASVDAILASGECCDTAHLAVTGSDLTALGLTGPAVGRTLHRLLDHVIDHPEDNERDRLLEYWEEMLHD